MLLLKRLQVDLNAQCIFVIYQSEVFEAYECVLDGGEPYALRILAKQMAFLTDEGQFYAFLHHIGKSPWAQQLVDIVGAGVISTDPDYHIDVWGDMDDDFKDLVKKLTAFDPSRRISAKEALEHPWFEDIELEGT